MKRFIARATCWAVVAASGVAARQAAAQAAQPAVAAGPPPDVTADAPPRVQVERKSSSPPNRIVLGAGIVAFATSYVPSVIVALSNDNSYDDRLAIPVVGPWLDLGERPGCGGIDQSSCSAEAGFTALLIVSGALQGLGVVTTVVGLFLPEHRTTFVTTATAKRTLHLAPARLGRDAYGLSAFGTF